MNREQEIQRKVELILSDPRFVGTHQEARQIAEELTK